MSLKRVINTARGIDKAVRRWRSPDRRRLLVNARTAMNYATIAPIVERLQPDNRLSFTSPQARVRLRQDRFMLTPASLSTSSLLFKLR